MKRHKTARIQVKLKNTVQAGIQASGFQFYIHLGTEGSFACWLPLLSHFQWGIIVKVNLAAVY
jgi:uncharacterized protein (DUF2461 family)